MMAIPLGYAVGTLLQKDLGPFIAFAAGAFPIQTVATVLQRLANRQLGLEIGADTAQDQVIKLSGVDQSTADRIQEAVQKADFGDRQQDPTDGGGDRGEKKR